MAKKAPNPIDKHVGSRVRARRMALSISQEKLADALGITFQQVQKYEKGTNRISASRLQQIADILEVTVSFFYEGAPKSGMGEHRRMQPDHGTRFLSTRHGSKIERALRQVTDPHLLEIAVMVAVKIGTLAGASGVVRAKRKKSADVLPFRLPRRRAVG